MTTMLKTTFQLLKLITMIALATQYKIKISSKTTTKVAPFTRKRFRKRIISVEFLIALTNSFVCNENNFETSAKASPLLSLIN